MTAMSFVAVETCAGAGGQALGLSRAGFDHAALVENDRWACETLRANGERGGWDPQDVHEADLREWVMDPPAMANVDLLAGGVPCPPFSVAGKQLGNEDERDLFPAMLELSKRLEPRAVMIENVRGLMQPKFEVYRAFISRSLIELGYAVPHWKVLEAHHFGVPQLRPRTIMLALRPSDHQHFAWPEPVAKTVTVGEALLASMKERRWPDARRWAREANRVAPTLVGGSKKHGGADLGPTRAKRAWEDLGIDGHGVADEGSDLSDFADRMPKLTVRQASIIQGFPTDWHFAGRKTASYRQVGNAFPPPVAEAVGRKIAQAFQAASAGLDYSRLSA
jgi:DNA (cytosine-5)-methyltransferase 1